MSESSPLLSPTYLQLLPAAVFEESLKSLEKMPYNEADARVRAEKRRSTHWQIALLLAIATTCCFALVYGYNAWPPIDQGCTPYRCNAVIDWQNSGCPGDNESCFYAWMVQIDGLGSSWWPIFLPPCTDCTDVNCWSSEYHSNSLDEPPYPNGTLCYYNPCCYVPESDPGWLSGIECQPLFSCQNHDRYVGRLWFMCATSIVLGLFLLVILFALCFRLDAPRQYFERISSLC